MKYYFCFENDTYYSIEELERDFNTFKEESPDEYENVTFCEYLEHCQWYNNGSLETAEEAHIEARDDLRRYTAIVKRYMENASADEKQRIFEWERDTINSYIIRLIEARSYI